MTPLCVTAMQDSETCAQIVVQLVSDFGANVCSPCPTPSGPMLPVDVAVNFVVKNVRHQHISGLSKSPPVWYRLSFRTAETLWNLGARAKRSPSMQSFGLRVQPS